MPKAGIGRVLVGISMETIEIKCETKDKLNLAEMTEFQGGLKSRTDVDYDKIKLSIIKYGFSFPFFVWKNEGKNYILDGHGRFSTLCKMQKDGYVIPDLPVVYIQAKDRKEAKEKLLRLNSTYGKMTKESVLEFADDIDLNFEEIALSDTVIDFSDSVNDNENTDETNTSESDFNYQNQYGVIVICQNESEQELVYNKLNNEGYTCKVVCV